MKKYLLLLFVFFLFAKCDRCKDAPGTNYIFELPIRLIPQKDTFSIGDTINISSIFGGKQKEINTQIEYEFEDFNFYYVLLLSKIDSLYPDNTESLYSGLDDFTFSFDTTSQSNYNFIRYQSGDSSIDGFYKLDGEQYEINIDLVPQKKGLYFFRYGIPGDAFGKQDFDGRCKNRGLKFHMIMNGREDSNNSDFLYESPTEHFNTWIPQKLNDRFHDRSGYCFYVVE